MITTSILARRLLGGALAASLLVACGSGGSDGTGSGSDTTAPGPAPTGGATIVEQDDTRVITHPMGETTVPADPQRVVALGEEFLLADLLDLGVVPVASTATTGEFVGIDPSLVEDIEPLPSAEADFERLIALKPDVIITSTAIAELAGYDRLDEIAPTVAIDNSDWRRSYTDTAAVFGKEAEAAERLVEYDTAVETAKADLAAEGRTVTVATLYVGDSLAFWTAGPINVPQVLLDLGFTLTPDDEDLDSQTGRAYVSVEQLDLAAGEDLVMMQTTEVDGEDAAYQAFTESSLWQALPAVQADRVLVVDRLGYPGTPGRLALVDLFATELAR